MTDHIPSPQPTPWGHDLWQHLADNHALLLTDSELHEIVRLAVALERSYISTKITDRNGAELFEGDRVRVTWLAELGITEIDCEATGNVEYMADKFSAAWFVKFDHKLCIQVGEEGTYEPEWVELVQTGNDDEMIYHFEKLLPQKTGSES